METKGREIISFLVVRLFLLILSLFATLHPIQRVKIHRSLKRSKRTQNLWRREVWEYGPLPICYSAFLIIEEKVRWKPFENPKHQRRGFKVYRKDNKVIIEYYWERCWEALVRAKARRIALLRNHGLSKEAKICGFKNIDEIWILVLLTDWYRSFPEADQLALEELMDKILINEKTQRKFIRALAFFDANLKGRNLQNLDSRARWIIMKELMAYVEGV